jgi:hypothetical protein
MRLVAVLTAILPTMHRAVVLTAQGITWGALATSASITTVVNVRNANITTTAVAAFAPIGIFSGDSSAGGAKRPISPRT